MPLQYKKECYDLSFNYCISSVVYLAPDSSFAIIQTNDTLEQTLVWLIKIKVDVSPSAWPFSRPERLLYTNIRLP